jgi:uncharacterized membrane protein
MMQKTLLSFFFLFAFTISSIAQKGSIQCTVVDKQTRAPLEYASVSIYRTDSSLADGAVTKKDGRISLRVNEGSYFIKVDFIGYQPVYTPAFTIRNNETTNAGTISLAPVGNLLQDVTVSGQRASVLNKIDKRTSFRLRKEAMPLMSSETCPLCPLTEKG